MVKKALVTGCTGQDGSYLCKLLLDKGYKVYGTFRRLSTPNFWRLQYLGIFEKINLIPLDLTDMSSIIEAIQISSPDEVYNLAAQSFVAAAFEEPILTTQADGLAVVMFLEAIRHLDKSIKFYQASTSEMFGQAGLADGLRGLSDRALNESSAFIPTSPYAAAKLYGYWATKIYRRAYKLFACQGILFNHESPLRGLEFVTRKISNGVAKITVGLENELTLGNMRAIRDWGYAPEYCINKDVPILTTDGWKLCDDINEGQEIINFSVKENRLSKDKVIKKIIRPSKGDKILLTGRGVYLKVTPEHKIYYQFKRRTSKGAWTDWRITTAKEFYNLTKNKTKRTKYDYRLPHFQDYDTEDYKKVSDEQLYLIGALLAEGCLHNSQRPNGGIGVSISQSSIANEPVCKKIEKIINKLKLRYKLRKMNSGCQEWIFNAKSSKKILKWFDSPNVHTMPRYFYKLSGRQAEIVFKAMMDCDGSWGSMCYISKRYLLAVDFQTIAHLAGYRTTQIRKRKASEIYEINVIVKRKKYIYIQNVKKLNDKEKEVWCVQTKNGSIITRDNDCINISGNCDAMWRIMQHDEPDDFVVATNKFHSVFGFVKSAFEHAGLDWRKHVKTEKRFLRPIDTNALRGDYSKANEKLGWEPRTSFESLVKLMVKADTERWQRVLIGERFPWDAPNYPTESRIITRALKD